jgi:hypothetical protein
MTVMPHHDTAADAASLILTDQYVGAGAGPGKVEIGGGVVMASNQIADMPQLDNAWFVFRHGLPDGQWHDGVLRGLILCCMILTLRHQDIVTPLSTG